MDASRGQILVTPGTTRGVGNVTISGEFGPTETDEDVHEVNFSTYVIDLYRPNNTKVGLTVKQMDLPLNKPFHASIILSPWGGIDVTNPDSVKECTGGHVGDRFIFTRKVCTTHLSDVKRETVGISMSSDGLTSKMHLLEDGSHADVCFIPGPTEIVDRLLRFQSSSLRYDKYLASMQQDYGKDLLHVYPRSRNLTPVKPFAPKVPILAKLAESVMKDIEAITDDEPTMKMAEEYLYFGSQPATNELLVDIAERVEKLGERLESYLPKTGQLDAAAARFLDELAKLK